MLVSVQLETCHSNMDGTAWYAYINQAFRPTPNFVLGLVEADYNQWEDDDYDSKGRFESAPLGYEMADITEVEEVPNHLSRHTGLWRFYVGSAV